MKRKLKEARSKLFSKNGNSATCRLDKSLLLLKRWNKKILNAYNNMSTEFYLGEKEHILEFKLLLLR